LTGCSSAIKINHSKLDKYEVEKTVDETTQNDFTFRLVSEKGEYDAGEDIGLYGELICTGEEDEITTLHSASAIIYGVDERLRGYSINNTVSEIAKWTTLKRNEAYIEHYTKSSIYTENKDEDYVSFVNDFL